MKIDITCALCSLSLSEFIPIFNVIRVPVMSMLKDLHSTHMEINVLRRLWRFRSLLTFLSFCLYVPSWCDDNANTPVFLFYRTTFLVFYTLRVFFAMHRLKKRWPWKLIKIENLLRHRATGKKIRKMVYIKIFRDQWRWTWTCR